jgi:hypothetical protein
MSEQIGRKDAEEFADNVAAKFLAIIISVHIRHPFSRRKTDCENVV